MPTCASSYFQKSHPICCPVIMDLLAFLPESLQLSGCLCMQLSAVFFKPVILTILLSQVGLLEKAQDMYARAYDIQSAKLGPEHPEVASTMNHTAGLLKVMGKFGDAESVYRTVCPPQLLRQLLNLAA